MKHDELVTVIGVQQTIAAYARYVDGRRLDQCAQLFTADATLEVMGEIHQGASAIRTWLDWVNQMPPGIHLTTNTMVDVTGIDTASAVSDVALVKNEEAGWRIIAAGLYEDSLRRDSGGWKFVSRKISIS